MTQKLITCVVCNILVFVKLFKTSIFEAISICLSVVLKTKPVGLTLCQFRHLFNLNATPYFSSPFKRTINHASEEEGCRRGEARDFGAYGYQPQVWHCWSPKRRKIYFLQCVDKDSDCCCRELSFLHHRSQ